MKYYKHPDFIKSVHTLYRKGNGHQNAAIKVLAILAKIQENKIFSANEIIHPINQTKNGERRIQNCIKYDIGSGCRLITTRSQEEQVLLFAGDHDEAEAWLNNNRGHSFLTVNIQDQKYQLPTINVSQNSLHTLTDIHDIIEASLHQLLMESRKNKQNLANHRKEIATIRQDIRITEATIKEIELEDCEENYKPDTEINNSKISVETTDCANVIDHLREITRLVKDNQAKNAAKLIEPVELNIHLLKLRLRYIQLLESFVGEMKTEINFNAKIHKLAIALELENADNNETKTLVGSKQKETIDG